MRRVHSPERAARDFCALVRQTMEARGLSYRALSALSGVNFSTIWHMTSGNHMSGLDAAIGVSRALGISLDRFAGSSSPDPE